MSSRFVSIWFRHLRTDWFSLSQPELKKLPFVLKTPSHGRMVITSTNAVAEEKGINKGMPLADARAIVPDLEVLDDKRGLAERLLKYIAEWCICFTPVVSIDPPDGLLLDASGCPHLWGGEEAYVAEISRRLQVRGYDVRVAIADTIGVASSMARFGKEPLIVHEGKNFEALLSLPPEALRLEIETIERLHKLGLHQIGQFINMPRSSLRRRFGQTFISQLDKALGYEIEMLTPVQPIEPYQERLPCMEPISTLKGIEIALQELLKKLCLRLVQEQKGLRTAQFMGYRIDGKVERIGIETNQPTHSVDHLFKLFEIKLSSIEPDLGIELFILEATKVEDHLPMQKKIWEVSRGLEDVRLGELIDKLSIKFGKECIHRYLPDEHYWPERSFKPASSLQEKLTTSWDEVKLRPLHVLRNPEPIEVAAPVPDYPPMLFRYTGKVHNIIKADGPERIEQEWWIQQGQHRDYYYLEDGEGQRYWIFRLGHYDQTYQWFIHGFFS